MLLSWAPLTQSTNCAEQKGKEISTELKLVILFSLFKTNQPKLSATRETNLNGENLFVSFLGF